MKRLIHIAALVVSLLGTGCSGSPISSSSQVLTVDDGSIARAYKNRARGVQVEGEGVVTRVLADDNDGSRHQRFIIRLASGQTLLIAHNIDIAPRIVALRAGDSLQFKGEYSWNENGGVVHWTHHDPQGRHASGWLKHNGNIYQ
jgi:Protein of unknown function (DUF3465)